MGSVVFKANDLIYKKGDKIESIGIVVKGSVSVSTSYGSVTYGSGATLGLPDIYAGEYIFNYEALDEVTVFFYRYTKPEDIMKMIKIKPEFSSLFTVNVFKAVIACISHYEKLSKQCEQVYMLLKDGYEKYKNFCSSAETIVKTLPEIENLERFEAKEELEPWLPAYYRSMMELPQDVKKAISSSSIQLCYGTIMEAAKHVVSIVEYSNDMAEYISDTEDIIMNSSESDIYSIYETLAIRMYQTRKDTKEIEAVIASMVDYLEKSPFCIKEEIKRRVDARNEKLQSIDFSASSEEAAEPSDGKLRAELFNSLDTILDYSRLDHDLCIAFKELIEEYKAMPDKNIIDTQARAIRKQITENFFTIYKLVTLRSFHDFGYSPVIKMFLNFGYMDEDLAGHQNAEILYKLSEKRRPDTKGIAFTAYEWLKSIYEGENEPSKNEFDADYAQDLREQKRSGKITEQQEKEYLQDNERKVVFEIDNVIKKANIATFGRVTSYCPVFSEHNVIKNLELMYDNSAVIHAALEKIRDKDFSAYYREVSYQDDENKIKKMYIQREILPVVVLMPNVGCRGVMWQEYAGNKKDSPSRMFIPAFCGENIDDIMLRLTGELRWEIVKSSLGSRWNDITVKSLTSEFSDYIQFYRKNPDLSAEAKERMRLSLSRCKNNFKEFFTREYIVWMKFESAGSTRLNRVSRKLLFNYCPFHPAIMKEVGKNPMFTEMIEKRKIAKAKEIKNLDFSYVKIEKEGGTITPELKEYREFLSI